MEKLDHPFEKVQISNFELFTLVFYINGEEGPWAKTVPHTAHAPTPFSFLINFFALSKSDQLQSLAISVNYFVVRRNC